MKNKIYMVVACLLFQSCFSYKKIEMTKEEIKMGHKYKVYTHKGAKEKLVITELNDSVIGHSVKEEYIALSISDIDMIKERKFSIIKTIGLPVVITGSLLGLLLISFQPDVRIGVPDYN